MTTSSAQPDRVPAEGPDPIAVARAAALDELARPSASRRGRRRSLFDRDRIGPHSSNPTGLDPADPAPQTVRPAAVTRSGGPGWRDRLPAGLAAAVDTLRGSALSGLAVLVVIGAVLGVFVMRRPPPAEETLPRAEAQDPTAASTAASGVGSGGPAQPSAGSQGTGTTVASAGSAAVSGVASAPVMVHVAGAVARPGVVTLDGGARVVDAVQAAGGMLAGADPDRVNLAAKLADGQRVVVPVIGMPAPQEVPQPSSGSPDGAAAAPPGGAPSGQVDLNTADETALDGLPGVGPATAAAIVAHREAQGPFRSVDDLLDVRGIGDAKLEALRDLVTVSG